MIPFHLHRLLLSASLALVLAGCGSPEPEDSQPTAPESRSAPLAGPQRATPAEFAPPARADNEGTEPAAIAQAQAERQALRDQRGEQLSWWEDDDLARELGLEDHQRQALLTAREELQRTRMDTRERLRAQRDLQRQAERRGDQNRLAEVRARTADLQQQLHEAGQAWDQSLRNILEPDQIDRLLERQPDALDLSR